MNFSGYDIVGDVHGCAKTLKRLLDKLGYQCEDGVYFHCSRKAIFVGDIIDRGPAIRETLHLVKKMVDNGYAECILGNHEFNALAYTTPICDSPVIIDNEYTEVDYVRPHNAKNNRLISETLSQFAAFPEEWKIFLNWLKQRPLFVDDSLFRVVHACWDNRLISAYKAADYAKELTSSFIRQTGANGSDEARLIDRLTRGTDLKLPDGLTIQSDDGFERVFFRTKFWSENPKTYLDVVFQPDPLPEYLMDRVLNEDESNRILHYHASEVPVFFGHYWLQGTPKIQKPNVACLDYSAVKYGKLVAYRFDGEQKLSNDKFCWVYVDPQHTSKAKA